MINIKEVITKYPECLESASKLRSYLVDLYPEERRDIFIICTIFECGIAEEIKAFDGDIDEITLNRFCDILENKFGITQSLSKECLLAWVKVFSKNRYDKNIEPVAAMTMPLFLLFDASASMSGSKIGQVNMAMKDIPKIIKEVSDGNPNSNIEVAAATFSSDVEWITPKPQTPDEFLNTWKDIQAEGLTSLGAALKALNEKMSRKAFLSENPMVYLAPAVIIVSGSNPTDDWETPLAEIQKNCWFKCALKLAFYIGKEINKDVLAKICGDKEAVIDIRDAGDIRQYIQFVSNNRYYDEYDDCE